MYRSNLLQTASSTALRVKIFSFSKKSANLLQKSSSAAGVRTVSILQALKRVTDDISFVSPARWLNTSTPLEDLGVKKLRVGIELR